MIGVALPQLMQQGEMQSCMVLPPPLLKPGMCRLSYHTIATASSFKDARVRRQGGGS